MFVVAYIAFRLLGHYVTSRLHAQAVLGTVDRSIGLGFGLIRALVFLGVFYLVFNLATPPELVPSWITNGKLYPLARVSARALQTVAPRSLTEGGRLGPALEKVVKDDSDTGVFGADHQGAAQTSRRNPTRGAPGYDKRSRDDIDALIERSR